MVSISTKFGLNLALFLKLYQNRPKFRPKNILVPKLSKIQTEIGTILNCTKFGLNLVLFLKSYQKWYKSWTKKQITEKGDDEVTGLKCPKIQALQNFGTREAA